MANDLLPIENGTKYSYKFQTNEGRSNRDVILDQSDSIWNSVRHSHIAETITILINNFNKFMAENKSAFKKGDPSSKGVNSLQEMRDTLNALPQFQELKGKVCINYQLPSF